MPPLDADRICTQLHSCPHPWRVVTCDEVSSTSDLVKEAGLKGEAAGLVLFAEAQTAGRGQRSNRWITPKGQDLMFSLLLRPSCPPELWPRVTTLAAVAICRALEATLPLQPMIKWPNDVYLGRKKVSGLLAETFSSATGPFLVLGIGLNVNAQAFPEPLQATATSLLQELPRAQSLDREVLAAALLGELDKVMVWWDAGFSEAVNEARHRSLLTGRQIRAIVEGREVFGKALDLNHEGHLMLQLHDGSSLALTSASDVREVR